VLHNLKYFIDVIANVTDDPATVDVAKKMVDEDLVVKNVQLTKDTDEIKGSVFDDTFKAIALFLFSENTLNTSDKIYGRDGNDSNEFVIDRMFSTKNISRVERFTHKKRK